MSGDLIERIVAWQVFDSRGMPTIAVRVELGSGCFGRAIAPSGASVGSLEATVKRSRSGRFGDEGVDDALRCIDVAADALVGVTADIDLIDSALESLDGTKVLDRLGGNVCVAISMATINAIAADSGHDLYTYMAPDEPLTLPLPMVNIFSGGRHAGERLDVQDFLVVPLSARDFAEAMSMVWHVRKKAAHEARRRGHDCVLLADEGGFGVPFSTNREAVEVLIAAVEAAGLDPGSDVGIAIDVAANQLWHRDRYVLSRENREFDSDGMLAEFDGWLDTYPAIVSFEDVLHDQDLQGWISAMAILGGRVQLLGDDLFATRLDRVLEGGGRWANAILIKPNQAGLFTRSQAALNEARAHGMATVVSARSGDTEESWLADLAVGWATDQIKVGSLARSERTAKWNRLLEIEKREPSARFVGEAGLRFRGNGTR